MKYMLLIHQGDAPTPRSPETENHGPVTMRAPSRLDPVGRSLRPPGQLLVRGPIDVRSLHKK
jgi:hypothetical protein